VPENVSICYRGANYAIGQGPQFYGIWAAAAPHTQPLEWWPPTPEGWARAWTRFSAIEVPGTIVPVAQAAVTKSAGTGRRAVVAATLLAVGVSIGVAGLFPSYMAGSSLVQQPDNLVLHVIYLAAWSASAALITLGGARTRVAALLGIGVSAVTLGLFFADFGTVMAGGASLGTGLVLSAVGWLGCTVGAVLGLRNGPVERLTRPVGQQVVPVVTLILAALGTAIAFAPSWDSFTLRTLAGATQTLTEGNAFANPAPVIVGDLAAMVGLVAVVLVAGLWRPIKMGAALVAGAVIPMAAQAISALVQIREASTTSPMQFGISPAQAAQAGLTVSAGLTPIFWVFCAFVGTVILLCGWMIIAPDAAPAAADSGPAWPAFTATPSAAETPGATIAGP